MKTKKLVSIFVSITVSIIGGHALAQDQEPSPGNTQGYFVKLIGRDQAVYGNGENSHLGDLKCAWDEQAENLFHIDCSSTTVKLQSNGLISQPFSAEFLSFTIVDFVDSAKGVKLQLHCVWGNEFTCI